MVRRYIVECKDQASPVSTAQLDAFRGRLTSSRHELDPRLRGIVVSSVGFVAEAKAQARYEDIELITISELESSLVDFRPYVRNLVERLETDSVLPWFVEPRLRGEHEPIAQPAISVLEQWLRDPVLNHLTILGDFGTGKTTLLRHLALQLARRYEEEVVEGGARGRVPLFVDLRDYTQALSLRQIILDLLDFHDIRTPSYAAFEHLSREGRLLLLLDGFDEMASRGNHQATLRNFQELNRGAFARAKIILSCRTHYFTSDVEVHSFVGDEHKVSLIRFRGHPTKGGYRGKNGRQEQEEAPEAHVH